MLFEKHNPQTDEMIQIMDQNGLIVRSDLMPDLSVNEMIEMYKTMVFVRVIDTKTVQYQRQGRILTYAPNFGQEATQVGSIFGAKETDWVASAFRELGVWLHKGIPLYNVLLYWYGNELGMQMPDSVRVLPVNIPIASQFQHATGLAYASMYKEEDDVVLAYVGDGGTSHGEFHEALNFAAVKNTANVFIIQNNQYAISTNRKNQSKSETLAQKSIAYGMPGRFVDGNDIFAMYAVTKEAIDYAREGNGPTLIEAYTYRLGAHTTADDPTVYRDDKEVKEWEKKDPIDRFRKYLMAEGHWDEEKENQLIKEKERIVKEEFEKVEKSGLVSLEDVFDYTYANKTKLLEEQYKKIKAREAREAK